MNANSGTFHTPLRFGVDGIKTPPMPDVRRVFSQATKRGRVPPDLLPHFVMWLGFLLAGVMAVAAAIL